MSGSGTLLNLKFNVVASSGQTALTFEDYTDPNGQFHHGFMFNEGTPPAGTTNGSITVGAATVSGTVTYGNAIGVPSPRGVPNVNVCAHGSPTVCTVTATDGSYVLNGLGSGPYNLTASKAGGVNGISAFDASRIAQYVAGMISLNTNQQLAADVSGNLSVTSFDAAQIGSYVAGSPSGSTGTWKFTPQNIPLQSPVQDFSALLMGDVSGNWSNTGERTAEINCLEECVAVSIAELLTPADDTVIVPVIVEGAASKGLIAYEFELRYDPSVLQPEADPVDLSETVSRGLSAKSNAEEPGLLKVAVYGPTSIESNGLLMKIRFKAVGVSGTTSPLTLEHLMFNEGESRTLVTNGRVELSATEPSQAEIAGRLLNSIGQGVPMERVTLTDTTGRAISTVSSGFGVFRFRGLQIGQTYVISVESKTLIFIPLTVSAIEGVSNVNLISQ